MLRLVRVSAIAGTLMLAGCSTSTSWMPNLGSFSSSANVSLTLESDPPGADARTSIGPTCRTPCMIPVPADNEFTVTFTLNGYQPKTLAVAPRPVDPGRLEGDTTGAYQPAELTPNPVYAQLEPAAPPASGRKRPARKKTSSAK